MNDPKNGELPKFKINNIIDNIIDKIKIEDFSVSIHPKEDLEAMFEILLDSSFRQFVKYKKTILYRNIIDVILVITILSIIYFLK